MTPKSRTTQRPEIRTAAFWTAATAIKPKPRTPCAAATKLTGTTPVAPFVPPSYHPPVSPAVNTSTSAAALAAAAAAGTATHATPRDGDAGADPVGDGAAGVGVGSESGKAIAGWHGPVAGSAGTSRSQPGHSTATAQPPSSLGPPPRVVDPCNMSHNTRLPCKIRRDFVHRLHELLVENGCFGVLGLGLISTVSPAALGAMPPPPAPHVVFSFVPMCVADRCFHSNAVPVSPLSGPLPAAEGAIAGADLDAAEVEHHVFLATRTPSNYRTRCINLVKKLAAHAATGQHLRK